MICYFFLGFDQLLIDRHASWSITISQQKFLTYEAEMCVCVCVKMLKKGLSVGGACHKKAHVDPQMHKILWEDRS